MGDAKARKHAAQKYNQDTAENLWKAFPPEQNGWEVISLVGGKGNLEKSGKESNDCRGPFKGKKDIPENSKWARTSRVNNIGNRDPDK